MNMGHSLKKYIGYDIEVFFDSKFYIGTLQSVKGNIIELKIYDSYFPNDELNIFIGYGTLIRVIRNS